MKIIYISY